MRCQSFSNIFGDKETSYSKIIAQTLVLSSEFKKMVTDNINSKHDYADIKIMSYDNIRNVILENNFDGNSERIDILFELENGLQIGIENKKWAALQPKQLIRYKDEFEHLGMKYILVFLSPKKYYLPEEEKPQNLLNGVFVELNYSEIRSICNKIKDNTNDSFTKKYFIYLNNFLGGLIMQPISISEINSLMYYNDAEKKITQIIQDIKTDFDNIEKTTNFVLKYKKIREHICYIGFRYGTQWYYNDELLKDKPEVLFFIKDCEPDNNKASNSNGLIEQIYNQYKDDIEASYHCQVNYYHRKKVNECRFSIRKSLIDFDNKEPEVMIKFFNDVLKYMENAIEKQ